MSNEENQRAFVRDFFRVNDTPGQRCVECSTPTDWTQDGLCRECKREQNIRSGILNPDGSER